MAQTLLKGGRIFDGERFFDGNVLIENGKILAIGKTEAENAIIYDVSGCIVTAGLIDIHTHFSEMGNMQFGYPADMASIPFGVTYAVDCGALYSNPAVLDSLSVETKVFIPVYLTNGDINYNAMEEIIKSYGDRLVGIKIYFDKTLNNQIDIELVKKVCEYARQKNLKVMVHCSNSPTPMLDIINALDKGDILTHAYHGDCSTIEEDNYIAYKTAKEKGVIIDAGMAGGVHTNFKIFKRAIENGIIPDTISSDITKFSAYMRGGVYGLPMCMSIARLLGMAEEGVFKAVTSNAKKAVNAIDWANMEVNAPATISVLKWDNTKIDITDKDGNNVTSSQGYVCKMTMKNGQILYRN